VAARHFEDWYQAANFSLRKIADNYPHRDQPAAYGWLKSEYESVRLVAVGAMFRENDRTALPDLLEALDDPYLLNRQFARKGVERMLNLRLIDHGYRFYMTPEERRQPLTDLRKLLLPAKANIAPTNIK
jgi:hypothetical protein